MKRSLIWHKNDVETVSIASTGSVRDRIAIFEAINEKLKHEKPQSVHKITSEEITHPKAPITETTITETTIEKRYAEEERPVAPERVTVRETREVFHETMPEPTRETIETVIHEVHYTQPEEHTISPEPVEETYVEESFEHEIIPSEVQAHVETKPYIEEIKPTETHLFKADEVPQREERYADRFEQEPTYQIEEEISQESEAIRRLPVREIEEVILKEPVVEEQVEVPIEVEKRVVSFQVGTPEHVPEERHGEKRSPSEPELAIEEHTYTIDEKEHEKEAEPMLAHKEPYPEQFEEEIPAEGHEHAEERHMEPIEEKHPEAIVKTPSHELPASFEEPEEQTSVIVSEERTYIRTLPSEVEEYPTAQLDVTTQEKIPEHLDDVHAHAEERHIETIEEKHPEAIVRTPSHELPASFEEPEEQTSVIVSEERAYIRTLPNEVEEYPEAQLNLTTQAYPEEKIPEHLDDVHEHAEERHMEPIEEKHPEAIVKTPSHELSASFEEPVEQTSVIVSEEKAYIRTLPSEVEEYPAAQFEDEIDEKHVIEKEISIEKHEAIASPTSYEQEYRYEREYSEEHDETGGISVPKTVAGAVVLGAMTIGEKIKSAVSGIGKGEEEEYGYEETKKESPSAEERTSYEGRFSDQESPLEEHISRVRESPVEEHDEYKHETRIEEAPIQISHEEHPSELEELSREPIEESPEIFRESPIQEHIVTAEPLVEEHRSEFLKEEYPSEPESQEILSPLEEKFGREEIKESPLEEIPSEPIQGGLEEEQLPKESHAEEISVSEQDEYPSEPIQEYHRELVQEKEYPEESLVEEIPSEPIQDQHHRELVQEKEYPEVSPVEEIPSEPIQELPRVEEPEQIQEKHESPEPQESPIEQEPSEMAQNFPHEPTPESPEEESYVLTESQIIEAHESPSEIPQPDPEKVTIKNAGKPFILRRIANISIFTGPGDLTAELIDPEGLPVKVELVKVSPEDYNLSFLPVKLGTYELNLFLSGLQVPVTPTSITVEEQGKPYLYGPALDYGVEENQPVSLIFDPKESKGGIKIDVRSPNGEKVRHTTDRRSDGSTEILFLPTQPGKHLVSVDFNNRPIYGSPYQVTVFGIEKVGGVEEEPVDQLTKIPTGTEFEPEEPVTKVELEHDVYPAGYEQRYQHETYEVYSEESQPRHEISIEEPEEEKSVIVSEERTYIRTLPTQIEELAQREPEIPQHERPFEEREATHPPSYEQEYRHEILEHEYPDESGISVPKMVAGAVVLGAMAIGEKVKSAVTGLGRGERETLGYEEEPETVSGQHYIGQEVSREEKVAREHLEEEPEYPIQPSDETKNVLLENLPPQEQWQYEYKEEEKPITPRGSPIREMEDQIEREFELHEEKYQMVESDSIPTAMDAEGKIVQEPVQEYEYKEEEEEEEEEEEKPMAPRGSPIREMEDQIEREFELHEEKYQIVESDSIPTAMDAEGKIVQKPIQESRLEEAPVEEEKIEITESEPSQREEHHTELAPESPTTSEEERDKIEAEYVTEAEKIRRSIEEISEPAIVKESVEIVTYPAEEEEQESETVVEERKPETEIVESEEVPSYIPAESKMEPDGQFVLTDSYTAEDSRPIEETAYYSSETEVVQSEEVPIHMPEEAKHEPEGQYEESSPAYGITETDSYTAEERRPIEEVEQYPSEPERISKKLVEEVLGELKLGEEAPTGLVPEETEHGLVESEKVAEPEGYQLSPKHKFEAEKGHPEEPEVVQVQLESPAVVTCEYHVVESEEVPTGNQIETTIKTSSKEFHETPDSKISREPEHYEESSITETYEIAQKPLEQQQEYEAYPAGYDQEYQYREDFPEESGISVPKMVAGAMVLGAMAIGEKVKSAVSGIGKRGDTYGYEAVPTEDGEGEFLEERDKRINEREPMLSYEEEEAEEVPSKRTEIFSDEQHKAVPYEAEVLRNEYQIIESEEIPSEQLHEEPRFDQEGIVHEPGFDQEDNSRFDQEELFEPEIVESEEVPSVEHEIRLEPEASHATHEEHEESLIEKESFEPELVESEEVPSVEHEIRFEPEAASHDTHEETLVEKESFEPELVESEEVPSVEHEIKFEPEAASHDTHEETLVDKELFEPELVESEEVPSVEHEIRFEPEASHATHEGHEETLVDKELSEPELVESEEVPPVEHEIRFEPEAASHATHEEYEKTLVDKELFEPELVESEEVPPVEHEIKFEPEAASHATHEEHVPAATPESEKFQTEFVESEEVYTEQPTPSGMPFTDFNENEQFIETEEFKTKESALRDARLDESIYEKESIVEDQEAIEHELVESETVEDVGQIPSSRLETDELEKREEEERPVHETEVKISPTIEYQLVESESYTIEPHVEQKIESPIHETVPEGRTPEKDEVKIFVTEDIPTEGKYEEEIIICESPVGKYLPSEEEEPVTEKQPTTPESPSRQYQMVESESVPLAIQHEPKFEPDSIQETSDGNYEQEYQEESGISVPKMVAGAIVLGAMSIGEKVKEAVSGIGKSADYETETFVTEYRPTGSPEFPEESDYEHKGAPEEHHIEPTKLVEEEYHVEPTKLEEEHHVHESHILPLSPKEVSDRLEKEIIEESLEKSSVEEEEMVESEEIPGERYIETIFEPEVAHPVTPIPIEEQGGEKPIEEDTKVEISPEEYVESEEIKHGFEPQAHEQISHISIEETESGYLVESEEVPKESQFVEPKFETELPSTKESFEEITAPESYLREEIIESEEVPSGEASKAVIGEAPEAVIRQHEEFSPETEQRYEKESLESPEDQLTPEKEALVVSEYEVVESEEVPGEEFLEEPKFEQAPRKSLESEDLTTSRTTIDEARVSRQESVEREPTEEIERVEIEEYLPEHPESGELRHEIETTSEPNEEFFEEEKPTRTTMEQESKLESEDFGQQQAYESESPLLTEYHLVESEELPAAPIPEPSFEPEISEKRESSYEDEKPHEESGITEAVTPGFPEQVVEKVEERITPDQQLLEEYDVVESEEIPQEAQEHPKLSVATAPVEEYDYPEEPIPSGEEDQSGKVPYTVSAGSVYQEPTETVHRTYEEEHPEEPEDSMSVPKMVAGAVVLGAMAIGERVKSAVSSLGKSEEGGGSYQEIDERLSAREEFEHGGVPSQHERQFEDLKLETGQVSHEEEKSPTISEHLSDKTIVLRETSETSFEDLQVDAPEDLLEMHGREETPEHEPSTPMVEHEHAARESPFQELHAPTPEDLLAIHEEEKDEYEIIESEEIPQAKFVPEAHRESPREVTPEELRVSTPEDFLEMHEGERQEHPGEQHEHLGERHEHPVIDSEESPKHEPEILETSEKPIEETQLRPTSGLSYEELEEAQRKSPISEELVDIQVKSEELVDAALLKVLTEEEPQESTSPFEIVESEDEALPQGDVPPAYDRLESIEAELQPTQLVASGGLGVTELPSRPKSPVPPRFFQEPEAEPALESHEVDVGMETSLEKFETDSLNEDSGSPETTAAPTTAQKHVSTDNLSEGSLQEFERLELELVRTDGSPSSIEAEIEKNGAGSIAGSINSLTEFENLEREIQETVPDDAMMLSDIREEEEAEVMSIREDDEEDENADSLRETRVVDPMLVSYYGGEPMITSVDSLELAAHQQHLGMEISLDSLGASNQNYITDKDSLLEGATSQENPSQDTQVLTGDTMGTYQEYQDEDDRDSLNEVIDSYPTTLTTFETVQMLDDGTAAQIIRKVQTRVTDPVHSHVRFTGTEDEAHLRSLPFDETVETVDEEGNITITTRKRAFS